jgi:hypothetical protein
MTNQMEDNLYKEVIKLIKNYSKNQLISLEGKTGQMNESSIDG